jgi:hypothetical protein
LVEVPFEKDFLGLLSFARFVNIHRTAFSAKVKEGWSGCGRETDWSMYVALEPFLLFKESF